MNNRYCIYIITTLCNTNEKTNSDGKGIGSEGLTWLSADKKLVDTTAKLS